MNLRILLEELCFIRHTQILIMESLREHMAELLCPVCLDPFDNPVTIPACTHNLCRKHILTLARYHSEDHEKCEFPCPKCRTLAVFPSTIRCEEDIRINMEMKAAVEFAMKVLQMKLNVAPQQQQQTMQSVQPPPSLAQPTQQPTKPNVVTSNPSVNNLPTQPPAQVPREDALRKKIETEMKHEEEAKRQWMEQVAEARRQQQQQHAQHFGNLHQENIQLQQLEPHVTDEEWYVKELEFERLKRQREMEKERRRLEKEHEIENKILSFVRQSEERTKKLSDDRVRREQELNNHLRKLEHLTDIGFHVTKMEPPPKSHGAINDVRPEDIANDPDLRMAELVAEDLVAMRMREKMEKEMKAQIAEERAIKLLAEIAKGENQKGVKGNQKPQWNNNLNGRSRSNSGGNKGRTSQPPPTPALKASYVPKLNKREILKK